MENTRGLMKSTVNLDIESINCSPLAGKKRSLSTTTVDEDILEFYFKMLLLWVTFGIKNLKHVSITKVPKKSNLVRQKNNYFRI